ncbi:MULTISPECIES: CmpA/NrtA family ABC transporter substrate-binding protein [Synechocystis]|uniref:ABC transporter substrate-binding protein n=1 Tax=Synechocystis salina LEGE 00031 TaxID=1828736 RepID=A0ABR9VV07_9SYNC|nr:MULTISPECIES: CmpA/NrtA family ABC transporter substrate-binding protein [Synechocystis]MBE9196693.1 ABC transporter substrate-binding protein [Synechocystis sp. LEGE 06083]MBE9241884.1 ABC transporter substrate-binding protein [Synechocystis salina LEGE 00041]MBE9255167.1 ABC transporter substrate-binding protein [Synechocystis salina LEGE 00031]
MGSFNRRKFLLTSAASATGALFLKGCTGNPPDPNAAGTGTSPSPQAAGDISPEMMPETPNIKLGYIPIVESAPLIIAQEKGFFAKYGMTGVEVSKQANWASARDNVTIGSQGGGIDGGQWQMPMPHLITEGIITNGNKVPMYVLAQLITQGNGIAVAPMHEGKGVNLDISKAADYIKGFNKTNGRKFKAAHTFPNVNQDFWIRYWFAAGGVDPDTDIDLLAVPPAETVQGMRNGTMDAFSTGDPWPYRIVTENIGYMAALTAQIWPYHPEEYLAIRADWVDKNPKATKALLKGIMEAQQWIDDPQNRPEVVQIVSGRNYFNVPPTILESPFKGQYTMGDGQPAIDDFQKGPLYWKDGIGNVSYPYKSHDLWFLTESMRWGFHKDAIPDFDTAQKIIDKVNREDIWREAATEAGFTADIPSSTSRGVETFFDGITFDPANPSAYLQSLTIKKV